MKCLNCCIALCLLLSHAHAQSAADLSYSEIDSLLDMYQAAPAKHAEAGIQLALEASALSGETDSLQGIYLEWAAVFYEAKGDLQNTFASYDKALEIFEQTHGIESARYANTLSLLADLHLKKGDYQTAMAHHTQAKDIRAKALGANHPAVAQSLRSLADVYLHLKKYDAALPLLLDSKDIQEKTLGQQHPDFASTLSSLAMLYQSIGNFDQALPALIETKKIQEQVLGKEDPEFAVTLSNLATLYEKMGNYDQALPLLLQTKNIREKVLGKDHPRFALTLNNLAVLYQSMGNHDQALPLLLQAKNSFGKTLGEDHPRYAIMLNNLAGFYKDMGDYEQALPLYIAARDRFENAFGKDHPNLAIVLGNLATLYKMMGTPEKALPLHEEAKNIMEKLLGREHPNFAIALNNLALLYQTIGDYERALPLFIETKNIRAKVLGEAHPSFTVALNNLAALYRDLEDYEQAWATALQALGSSSGHQPSAHITPAWADTLSTTSFASNKHLERAITTLDVIYGLLETDPNIPTPAPQQIIISDLAATLLTRYRNNVSSDRDKLRLLQESNDWLQRSLGHLHGLEQDHKAFALIDQNKSVLLLQATRSEKAYHLGDLPDSVVWQDRRLSKQQSQLQAKLSEQRSGAEKDSLRTVLNEVNRAIDALETQIKAAHPKCHKLKYQQPTVDVAAIQELLDDQTALLEYVISREAVHIFYIDPQEVVWKKQAVTKKELRKRIQKLQYALSNHLQLKEQPEKAYQRYTAQAYWFYEQLLAPVLKGRSGIKNLVIVTDGELGHLPFEAFLVEPAPQQETPYQQLPYLLNKYNISYNYSAALWQENNLAPAPTNNGQIFGVAANYDLPLDSALLEVRLPTDQWTRATLDPLPGARQEVEMLQELYRGFFAFDSLASEQMVKQNASDFAILHFATHGLLDEKRPMLSSLALSEDNDSTESNFWQAHEISKMTLNANLVVLSACETGYGKFEQGNGIASLARSFMYAGAPSMVVSLWQVNDYASAQIMEHFYRHLSEGLPIDQALRQAKLEYLETAFGPAAHPIFWSSFIHMGKTTPVALQPKGAFPWTWILGGGLGLLVLGGGWLLLRGRRREMVA